MIAWLPWIPAALGLIGAVVAVWALRDIRAVKLRNQFLIASAVAAGVMFLVLVWLFIVAAVEFETVFLYTSIDTPLRYRIAGAWAGQKGSLALWATLGASVTAVLANAWRDRLRAWTVAPLAILSAAFLGAVAWQDLFAPTSQFFLAQRPGGNGLNPTLQSDFFVIHPPLMFLAYALTHVPFAAAIGGLARGSDWSHPAKAVRWNWLLYTVAMGLGGIWAYYTLGFGGYWAWDPVEVANLLPWLALTVYLHARLHHAKFGDYATMGPLLAILPFLLTLFSTISTRSGLWVSVHAFTDPTQTFNPDAPARFLDILHVEPSLRFYVALTIAGAGVFLALWTRRLSMDHDTMHRTSRVVAGIAAGLAALAVFAPMTVWSSAVESIGRITGGHVGLGIVVLGALLTLAAVFPAFSSRDEQPRRYDIRGLNHAAVLILGASLLVLWLWHLGAANGWNTAFYEARLPWLAAPAVIALSLFMLQPLGRRQASTFTGSIAVTAIAAGIWKGPGVGLLVAAAALVLVSAYRLQVGAHGRFRRPSIAPTLLAIGALLDLLWWLNPPSDILGVHVQWPIQILAIPALIAWHRSIKHLSGQDAGFGTTALLVAVLGGFYIAPILAGVAWLFRNPLPGLKPKRLAEAGMLSVHFAVAIALTGYAASTYLGAEESVTMDVGQAAEVAGVQWRVQNATTQTEAGLVSSMHPQFDTAHGVLAGTLYWEPSTGSYYPLPSTLRTWDRDVYVAVDAVCLREDCSGGGWVRAYEQTFQRPDGIAVSQVQFTVHVLPGLGLVWLALAIFGHGMFLRLTHSGEDLIRKASREPT